jgi:hypothetical protein
MSATGVVQIITAITALIGAIAGVLAVIRIQIVRKSTDGIVTKLLIEGKAASHAEGVATGIAQAEAKEKRRNEDGPSGVDHG